jgi:hypothetical protein
MRRVVVIALVVVVVMTGIPVLMGGMDGMASCAECGPGLFGPMVCLGALAAGFALLRLLALWASFVRPPAGRSRLLSDLLERPPQPAVA